MRDDASTDSDPAEVGDAATRLRGVLRGEVDVDVRRRAEYSSDASNYRIVPAAVLFPADTDDVVQIVGEARRVGIPLTARGGGTSVAGNAIGPGWVLDFSRHLNAVLDVDPDSRTARVQPGTVLTTLQRAAAPSRLRFGPDPSTQARATLGGMIGNDACGPRAVSWGRTSDNVCALRMVDGTGRLVEVSEGFADYPGLEDFTLGHLELIRTEFGRFGRQVSGYALQRLLPESGRALAQALSGTEGSCGLVVEATVKLVRIPAVTMLTVLGYPDMPSAADDVTALLPLRPLAIESMDSYLVDVVRRHAGGRPVPALPSGGAWLFVETSGETVAEALASAEDVVKVTAALGSRIVTTLDETRSLWRIREDGVGLAGRTPDNQPAWPGWEDAAVPPAVLGDYLRDFERLKVQHGVQGLSYGHVGDGCIHTRLDLPIADAPKRFRTFLEDAADLVAGYGGSLSGEHGDGRARGELLSRMYSPAALRAFDEFKDFFDPDRVHNPGIIVDPAALDDDLRLTQARPVPAIGFALHADGGDLSKAVHRCVGVGKCRADNAAAGGFMCPSFHATRDEKDSTRGRARVLQEMVNGSLIRDGWQSPEAAESLDLCLSCKACASDCPAGVDMATYKSEFLYRRYRGKRRPMSHYTLGWLPVWLRLTALVPWPVNLVARRWPRVVHLGLRMAGADPRREVPELPARTFRRQFRSGRPGWQTNRPRVVLWVDSFTNGLAPEIARAAVTVLEHAGYSVVLTRRQQCCGLTWITTGQLDVARRLLRKSLDALEPFLQDPNIAIVGLEPSCTAVLRCDVAELLPDDPRATELTRRVHTVAEFLGSKTIRHPNRWQTPRLDGIEVLAQPHCHQHAVMGWEADRALLVQAGATVTSIAGCCGLAGNFGMEKGHYDVSVAVAENGLLPALRNGANAVFLADGFSCRTQAIHLSGRTGRHLVELLADRLRL
ncbi:MAG: FAD-binding and (Fe-S)-binding domain-containing protein [Mycobacterium sp.]